MTEGLRRRAQELAGEVVLSDDPGDVVRSAREHHDFTQAWLAPHLGVRRESLSRIESGHSSPQLAVVDRFARVLALARHVRDVTARAEAGDQPPDPDAFEAAGRSLGLDPDETARVAAEAVAGYRAKRRSLLEGVDEAGGSR